MAVGVLSGGPPLTLGAPAAIVPAFREHGSVESGPRLDLTARGTVGSQRGRVWFFAKKDRGGCVKVGRGSRGGGRHCLPHRGPGGTIAGAALAAPCCAGRVRSRTCPRAFVASALTPHSGFL